MMFRQKNQNIGGLQLSDMLAYDVTREILIENHLRDDRDSGFSRYVRAAVQAKYDRCQTDGRIYGFGKVLIK